MSRTLRILEDVQPMKEFLPLLAGMLVRGAVGGGIRGVMAGQAARLGTSLMLSKDKDDEDEPGFLDRFGTRNEKVTTEGIWGDLARTAVTAVNPMAGVLFGAAQEHPDELKDLGKAAASAGRGVASVSKFAYHGGVGLMNKLRGP
jgi:hypothetical protein